MTSAFRHASSQRFYELSLDQSPSGLVYDSTLRRVVRLVDAASEIRGIWDCATDWGPAVYGIDESSREQRLVVEFVTGRDLEEWLETQPKMVRCNRLLELAGRVASLHASNKHGRGFPFGSLIIASGDQLRWTGPGAVATDPSDLSADLTCLDRLVRRWAGVEVAPGAGAEAYARALRKRIVRAYARKGALALAGCTALISAAVVAAAVDRPSQCRQRNDDVDRRATAAVAAIGSFTRENSLSGDDRVAAYLDEYAQSIARSHDGACEQSSIDENEARLACEEHLVDAMEDLVATLGGDRPVDLDEVAVLAMSLPAANACSGDLGLLGPGGPESVVFAKPSRILDLLRAANAPGGVSGVHVASFDQAFSEGLWRDAQIAASLLCVESVQTDLGAARSWHDIADAIGEIGDYPPPPEQMICISQLLSTRVAVEHERAHARLSAGLTAVAKVASPNSALTLTAYASLAYLEHREVGFGDPELGARLEAAVEFYGEDSPHLLHAFSLGALVAVDRDERLRWGLAAYRAAVRAGDDRGISEGAFTLALSALTELDPHAVQWAEIAARHSRDRSQSVQDIMATVMAFFGDYDGARWTLRNAQRAYVEAGDLSALRINAARRARVEAMAGRIFAAELALFDARLIDAVLPRGGSGDTAVASATLTVALATGDADRARRVLESDPDPDAAREVELAFGQPIPELSCRSRFDCTVDRLVLARRYADIGRCGEAVALLHETLAEDPAMEFMPDLRRDFPCEKHPDMPVPRLRDSRFPSPNVAEERW